MSRKRLLKLFGNLVAALLIFPGLSLAKVLYTGNFDYSPHTLTTTERILNELAGLSYPLFSVVYLFFVLFPIQLLKDYLFVSRRKLTYFFSVSLFCFLNLGMVLIFMGPEAFIALFTFNIVSYIIIANFLYFSIDIRVYRTKTI